MQQFQETALRVAELTEVGLLGTKFDPNIVSHQVTLREATHRVLDVMSPREKRNLIEDLLSAKGTGEVLSARRAIDAHWGFLPSDLEAALFDVMTAMAKAILIVGPERAETQFRERIAS